MYDYLLSHGELEKFLFAVHVPGSPVCCGFSVHLFAVSIVYHDHRFSLHYAVIFVYARFGFITSVFVIAMCHLLLLLTEIKDV